MLPPSRPRSAGLGHGGGGGGAGLGKGSSMDWSGSRPSSSFVILFIPQTPRASCGMNRANQEVRGHYPGHTRDRRRSHSAVLGSTNAKSLCFLGVCHPGGKSRPGCEWPSE